LVTQDGPWGIFSYFGCIGIVTHSEKLVELGNKELICTIEGVTLSEIEGNSNVIWDMLGIVNDERDEISLINIYLENLTSL